MKQKKITIFTLAIILLIVLIIPAGCKKPAEFEVENLWASPSEIVAGETVAVSINVTNIGETDGIYRATLKLDENDMEAKDVNIVAGHKETVTWQVTVDDPGLHQFTTEGMTGSFKILRPAEFKVVSLVLPSEPVVAKIPATVQVQVENIGEVEGTYIAKLQVDEEEITKSVTCPDGESKNVLFTVLLNKKGTYNIAIDNIADVLEVLQMPLSNAAFTEDDLPSDFGYIDPDEIGFPVDAFTDFEEYGGEVHDFVFFINPLKFEMVFAFFVSPISVLGQAQLNRELANPDIILQDIGAVMESDTENYRVLPEITGLGDNCVGLRLFYVEEDMEMNADCCLTLREEILSGIFVMWFEGDEPSASILDLARLLDEKMVEVLSTR